MRAVLVDVVVTDGNGSPIIGLKKDNFEVFEDKEPQALSSFEEHRGGPAGALAERAKLPPHFYTNAPLVDPSGSVNILLLDALNTRTEDQAWVRQQMIKYLKTIDPGPRLAIFTLGEELRMVEGFTSDPHELLAALNHKGWGGMPQASHLQPGGDEDAMEQKALAQMADVPGTAGAIQSLQNFLSETRSIETTTQMSVTLQVLQTLARYLSAFPGRKNLIWFSGSFPQIDFPSTRERMQMKSDDLGPGGGESGLGREIKKTLNLLASAQVAVYPIGAEGLQVDSVFQASALTPQSIMGGSASARAGQGLNDSRANEDMARYANQSAADDIAKNTGGTSFNNTNGLEEALADAVRRGSYYYRISYSPSNKRMQGRYRRIRVNVSGGHYKLAYRRGYFEETEKEAKVDDSEPTDPLQTLMARGLPDSTQIIYNLRILPSNKRPGAKAAIAGDNKELRAPLTRFGVDFVIPVDNLNFQVTPDGVRDGHIELSLLIYDHNGRPLNWAERSFRTVLKPKVYPAVQSNGVQFHLDIDAPPGDLYMRTGIYDFGSNNAGTLEVPLAGIKSEITIPSSVTGAKVKESVPASPEKPSNELSSNTLPTVNESSGQQLSVITYSLDDNYSMSDLEKSGVVPPMLELNSKSEIASYCLNLGNTNGQSSALTNVCNFALSMHADMPDIICDRLSRRSWWNEQRQQDTVTATVTYRNWRDYYSNVKVNGKTVDATFLKSNGPWSDGEFANILGGIFMPLSKTSFRAEKDGKVHSRPAFVFQYRVLSSNNHSYYIDSAHQIWLPEYHGRIWIDKATSQLLRIERETGDMSNRPIIKMKTTIDYSEVAFENGSKLVLPMDSDVSMCSRSECSHNSSTFMDWRKFGASTNIILNSKD